MIVFALTSPAAAPDAIPKAPAPAPASARGTFNPELPPSVVTSLDKLASEGVTGPVAVIELFIIALMAVVMYLRRNAMDKALRDRDAAHALTLDDRDDGSEKERAAWSAELSHLQESRLALLERVMVVAGNATAVIQMHATSNSERTSSAEKMTEALRDFLATASASQRNLDEALDELRKQGRKTTALLSRFPAGPPAPGPPS